MLLTVFLPLSLAFIMFALGLGLTLRDFSRVVRIPKAFAVGAAAQILLLPVTAFILLQIFQMTPQLAVGVMILSLCPGGVTSNMLTKLANGALALSITLTAVISLVSVVTVPFLVDWSSQVFMGADAPDINVTVLAISMFAITAVPVAIGVALRHFVSEFSTRMEPVASKVATVLFVVIVVGALAANWNLFLENILTLGPVLVLLNIVLIAFGFGLARLSKLSRPESICIAIETGVQNATLGITVGSLIMEVASGLPPFSLPSGVYGITMYIVTIPFVLWARSWSRQDS